MTDGRRRSMVPGIAEWYKVVMHGVTFGRHCTYSTYRQHAGCDRTISPSLQVVHQLRLVSLLIPSDVPTPHVLRGANGCLSHRSARGLSPLNMLEEEKPPLTFGKLHELYTPPLVPLHFSPGFGHPTCRYFTKLHRPQPVYIEPQLLSASCNSKKQR